MERTAYDRRRYGMGHSEWDVLTRTDPGSPGGELLRGYWQPVALAEEIPPGSRVPVPLRILGEDLVLFRDDQDRLGLLGVHCAHRGADLSYGRCEDGGLRCLYHGWLYDIHGACREMPGEAPGTAERVGIRHLAYPCIEQADTVWSYLGPGEPPLLPNYEFLTVPTEHVFAIKLFHGSNYLHANEGNLDWSHTSFLHYHNRDPYGQAEGPDGELNSRGRAPFKERVEAEVTDLGLRVCKIRDLGFAKYLNVGSLIFPNAASFGGRPGGYSVNWHVPIDDDQHWKFTFIFDRDRVVDKAALKAGRQAMTPGYRSTRNRENRYLQDRDTMKFESYSGMGQIAQPEDLCMVEGIGPIQDRAYEHLVPSDAPLVAERTLLLKAVRDVQQGREPPYVARSPGQNRFSSLAIAFSGEVPADTNWREFVRELDRGLPREVAR